MQADRVIVNADVRVMDVADTRAEAVALRADRILAVGPRAEVERAAGPGAEVMDAGGATVLPGFVDPHQHPAIIALYGGVLRLSPPAVTDIASLQRALAERAAALPEGRWLVAVEWDELLLAERRPPTRRELDEAVPDRPLFALHFSCHRALANSRALALAGVDARSADPAGGAFSRGRDGEPDGLLIERGMSPVESLARRSLCAHDLEGFMARLAEHHRALLAAGVTRVVDATVPLDMITLYREAERRGLLAVPTVVLPVSTRGYLEAPWDVLDEGALARAAGDSIPRAADVAGADRLLSIGPVKLVFDGTPVCAMCLGWWQMAGSALGALALSVRQGSLDAVRASLSLKPTFGRKVRTGIRIYDRREAKEIVCTAADRGFPVAIHAIGNEAVEIALDACAAAGPSLAQHGLTRLEHATFLSRDLVARIREAGLAVVAQPAVLRLPALGSAPGIPGIAVSALRWLLDAGVPVAASSDAPVIGFDPLDGVRAAMSRRTIRGHVLDPSQRVTLTEALGMATRVAAEAAGCGAFAGTLSPGKRADVVVLDRSLADEASIEAARVRATFAGGALVFGDVRG